VRQRVDALTAQWNSQQVPNLAACFRLALEVLDTYGPEGVDVEDRTDAAIWNNKYVVWLREFGGEPPVPLPGVEGGEGDVSAR
jgi:GH25 family lysozyme M1 (1,4-beta-N-acetylmuramidase)